MSEWLDKSDFFHFGTLPQVSIHSIIEDQYSKMYIPREKCDCGCSEWIDGKMKIVEDCFGYEFPKKDVHRCKDCNEVRMADHVAAKRDS